MKSSTPAISVIIYAYNRDQYLLDAIKSVVNQTLARDLYEIVVIKNFWQSVIDSYIAENNVISLYDESEAVGQMILNAVDKSSGNVLSFLEDDDLFEANKLKIVYNHFNAFQNDGFYRNDYFAIDDKGRPYLEGRQKHQNEPIYIRKKGGYVEDMPKIFRFELHSYPSCMSIRREILLANVSFLGKVRSSQDHFIFYCGVLSSKRMYFDNLRLTGYRIHTSASRFKGSFQDYQEKLKIQSLRDIETFKMVNSAPSFSDAAFAKQLSLLEARIHLRFAIGKDSGRITLMEVISLFWWGIQVRSKYFLALPLLTILVLLAPNFGSRLHYKIRSRSFT